MFAAPRAINRSCLRFVSIAQKYYLLVSAILETWRAEMKFWRAGRRRNDVHRWCCVSEI
jgi:hypothetical protein